MAKGLRSKVKKRMRTAKRQHYYEVEGKYRLQEILDRLHDPAYKPAPIPVNAFVHPTNPDAVFPQHAKPHIIDFRAHKMAMSGIASRHVFRKHFATNSIKSKYQTIVKDNYELALEEEEK